MLLRRQHPLVHAPTTVTLEGYPHWIPSMGEHPSDGNPPSLPRTTQSCLDDGGYQRIGLVDHVAHVQSTCLGEQLPGAPAIVAVSLLRPQDQLDVRDAGRVYPQNGRTSGARHRADEDARRGKLTVGGGSQRLGQRTYPELPSPIRSKYPSLTPLGQTIIQGTKYTGSPPSDP